MLENTLIMPVGEDHGQLGPWLVGKRSARCSALAGRFHLLVQDLPGCTIAATFAFDGTRYAVATSRRLTGSVPFSTGDAGLLPEARN